MDWYSWLSKSLLEPSLVYDYSSILTQNELEEEDIVHFDHEFLKSMGISIAKHRLEILKLAKKENKRLYSSSDSMAKLVTAMRRTKKCLSSYIHKFVQHNKSSAIVVMPRASYGCDHWRRGAGLMLKRSKKLMLLQQGRLMITDGGVKPSLSRSASPMIHNCCQVGEDGDEEEFWGSEVDDSKWHSMFQNLKPT